MIRLVTRLAHARSIVRTQPPRPQNAVTHPPRDASWILLPANARRQWSALLDRQDALRAYTQAHAVNRLDLRGGETLGVITAGVARNYFLENAGELGALPHHLHVGAYRCRRGAPHAGLHATRILVRGWVSAIERQLAASADHQRVGRDVVRKANSRPATAGAVPERRAGRRGPPPRPPQLCQGPARRRYRAIKNALATISDAIVT
jgi:indolepyruvate ferredoxin oxidoreductase alpha subunit